MNALKSRRGKVAAILKTLGHPDRLGMVCVLAESPRTVGQLVEACGISQSYASQGLKRMEKEGLLKSHRDGSYTLYAVKDPRLKRLLKSLKNVYCPD